MRKYSFVLSAVAVTGLTVAAKAAPESIYFLDMRNNVGAGQSITAPAAPFTIGQGDFPADTGPAGGGAGGGQVLRVSPTIGGPAGALITGAAKWPDFDADANASTGSLWLYAIVNNNQDAPAGTGDVISSIGLDMSISTSATTPRYDIASVSYAWTYVDGGGNANFGTANGTSSRTGVVGAKYVKVPVAGTPAVYAAAGGLQPNPGVPVQLGRLQIAGAARDVATPGTCGNTGNTNAHANASTYDVKLSINNLLITRTFSTGGNATPEERVSLGYTGGAVEADVSGNSTGGAGVRDAVIQVRMKNDSNGSGHVNGFDIPGFVAAQAAGAGINISQRYLYDNVAPANVNGFDIPVFTAYQTAPCP